MGGTGRGGARALICDRRFLGLALMEFWERFAMSGVKSLLIVTLADHVLAGDPSGVLGAASLQRMFDTWFGTLTRAGMASQIYGYINALLYAAILLGGLAGDLVLGRRGAVFLGGGVMCAGLAMMLKPFLFLPGLILFASGAGTLKGNLSAQLGLLFPDEAERQRGYALYLGFLNAGVICGPLVCGLLAARLGWRYAVAAAGLALVVGLTGYAVSAPEAALAEAPPPSRATDPPAPGGRRSSGLLIAAILSIYCCYSAYDQIGDAFLLWARNRIALQVAGWTMPVSWFLSLDGLFTLLLIAGWQAFGPILARRGIVLDAVTQILLGSILCAAGYVVLAVVSAGGQQSVPLASALAYLLLVDCAIVLVWPSGHSLITSVASPRRAGFWTGLFYLHGFFSSLWVGIAGSFYGRLPDQSFWLLHAAVAGLGAILALWARSLQSRRRPFQAITTSA
jgi:POT family proton-dependent oligopeptide transporter